MKKSLKKVLIVILVLSLTLLAACGGKSESTDAGATKEPFQPRAWKIGHVRPEGTSTHTDVESFAAALNEGSNGNIALEIYPSSQLGNYTVVQERISLGDIEMQLAPAGTSVNKGLGIASAPYIVTTWDEAREVFKRDGKLMSEIKSMLADENITLIAAYPKYFGGIALKEEPTNVKDVSADKGIKIRVPNMKAYEKTAQALGFTATPIAYSEAFTAIQTGIVDGAIGSGAEGYYASFRDVTNYYLPLNDHFEMWFLYMSTDVWNGLSAEEQALVADEGLKLEEQRFVVAEEEQKHFEEELAASGIEVYEFSQEELTAMQQKVKEEVWPEIKDEFGADLFDSVVVQ